MADMDRKELESALEAILFASGEPVQVDRICVALDIDRPTAEQLLQKLMDYYAYERRGIRLLKIDDSWQLCSAPDYAETIRKAFEIRKPAKLSQPALEVLTIIAYYQPTTRAYVDQIRGVDSSYTVGLLLDRGLIEECGRLQVPGRPRQYRTTKQFLRAFHLSSLKDLPELPDDIGEDGQMRLNEAGEVVDPMGDTEAPAQTGSRGDLTACKSFGYPAAVIGWWILLLLSVLGNSRADLAETSHRAGPGADTGGSQARKAGQPRKGFLKRKSPQRKNRRKTKKNRKKCRKSRRRRSGKPKKTAWKPTLSGMLIDPHGRSAAAAGAIEPGGRGGAYGSTAGCGRYFSWRRLMTPPSYTASCTGRLDRDAGAGTAAGDPPAAYPDDDFTAYETSWPSAGPSPGRCCGGSGHARMAAENGDSRTAVASGLYEEEKTSTSRKG